MSIEHYRMIVSDLEVEVVRKVIKNLHIAVYPPDGTIRVAAPKVMDDEAVRLAVVSRLGWIKRERVRLQKQPRETPREMVTGESHYVFGTRCRLDVVEAKGKQYAKKIGHRKIRLYVRPGSDKTVRQRVLERWYRQELKSIIQEMIPKWEKILNIEVAEWGVKKMKTQWGTCNADAKRIWLNLELAKKPLHCLEYVIVHEMAHLIEPSHNERFLAILDRALPQWRLIRDELNRLPIERL